MGRGGPGGGTGGGEVAGGRKAESVAVTRVRPQLPPQPTLGGRRPPQAAGQHPAFGRQHGTPPGRTACPGHTVGALLVHEARGPRASVGAAGQQPQDPETVTHRDLLVTQRKGTAESGGWAQSPDR